MRHYIPKKNRKASLNLSVNAIVVLVMAITMLGLGLAFIRDKFGSAGDLVDDVQQKVKDSIIEDFATGPDKISFPMTTFKMKSSDEYVAAMGIKNMEEETKSFVVELYPKNTQADVSSGITMSSGNPIPSMYQVSGRDADLQFQYVASYPDVAVNDYRVVPIKLITRGETVSTPQTHFIRLNVCIDENDNGRCGDTGDVQYAQKEFFIEIV